MIEPTQTCRICGRSVNVILDGRGFPPDIAKRKLQKACRAAGHKADPQYIAGTETRRQYYGKEPLDYYSAE